MKTAILSFVASVVLALSASVTLPPHTTPGSIFSAHGYSNEEEIDLHLYGLSEEGSDPIFC